MYYMYTYIYIYIYTLYNAQLPTPFLSSLFFTLRGGLTQRGGSYDGFFLAWTFGNIKWQSARAARVPISGPSHPIRRSASGIGPRSRTFILSWRSA